MKTKSGVTKTRVGPTDRAGRGLVGYAPGDPFGLERFLEYQKWVLQHGHSLKPNASALAALIAECALTNIVDLEHAYAELKNVYRVGDDPYIQWSVGEVLERRRPGPLTLLALKRVKKWSPFGLAWAELAGNAGLGKIYEGINPEDILATIVDDGIPFGRLVLPPALYCHISAEQRFSLLTKSTLARLESGKAILVARTELQENTFLDVEYTLCLDAAFLQHPIGKTDMLVWCGKLTKALRPPGVGTVATKKRAILSEIAKLIRATSLMGQCASILAAFSVQLLLEGTATTRNISVGTPYDYVYALMDRFVGAFHDCDITSLTEEEYMERAKMLLGDEPSSKLRAGFLACHCFLRSLEVVPRLALKFLPEAASSAVEAKVIWDHEIQKISRWLEGAGGSRLIEQCKVGLHILRTTGVRSGELLRVRLESIRVTDSQIEFDIAPLLNDPKLKSRESRRHQTITDPVAVTVIAGWVTRRRIEDNLSKGLAALEQVEGYLFGEPNNPRALHKAGALLLTVSRMVKAVSGDPAIGLHAFRHTISSNDVSDGWGHENGDVNPLDTVGAQRGHSSVQVDLNCYCHQPELPLYFHWNKRLFRFELNSLLASQWTGVGAGTLRKRVQRYHSSHPQASKSDTANFVYWQALTEVAGEFAVTLPGASTGFNSEDAKNPLTSKPESSQVSYRQVMGVLEDLSREVSTEVAGLRNDLTPNSVTSILEHFTDVTLSLSHHRIWPLDRPSTALLVLRGRADIDIGFALQFSRSRQGRWHSLRKWLIAHSQTVDAAAGAGYWLQYVQGKRLPLVPNSVTPVGSIFRLLKLGGVPTNHLCILVNGSISSLDEKRRIDVNALRQAAMVVMSHPPTTVSRSHRRGRPLCELGVGDFSLDKKKLDRQGAGFSLQGFHCLMLCALVTQRVNIDGGK